MAAKGPCVIVGRCADTILKDRADCLTVFIHADLDYRAKRIVEVYGERAESPAQRIKESDKRRAAYHQFYSDDKWVYASHYHIALSSSVLGIEPCVSILQNLF